MSTVLVVDDEPDIRLLCRLTLEGRGHEVLQADTAEAALGILRTVPADFVLLDIRMPGMGGWAMLEQVREDPRLSRTKVIVCSAHTRSSDERLDATDGVYAFLAKPFLPADLRQLVEASGRLDSQGQIVADPPWDGRMSS